MHTPIPVIDLSKTEARGGEARYCIVELVLHVVVIGIRSLHEVLGASRHGFLFRDGSVHIHELRHVLVCAQVSVRAI